jgi:hypothetical protein
VTLEVGKVIQRGRQSKGLTQKDLATVRLRTIGLGKWVAGTHGKETHRVVALGPALCPHPSTPRSLRGSQASLSHKIYLYRV